MTAQLPAGFTRGNKLMDRARDWGREHPGATEEETLAGLDAEPTPDNAMYVRIGLMEAAEERERAKAPG